MTDDEREVLHLYERFPPWVVEVLFTAGLMLVPGFLIGGGAVLAGRAVTIEAWAVAGMTGGTWLVIGAVMWSLVGLAERLADDVAGGETA